MLRAAAPNYARVLRCSGVSRAHRTRSVANTLWANAPLTKMQRRTRSSDAAAAPADTVASTLKSPRRPSRKAQQITIKEEVHESERISPSVAATRRSARVKIKSEIVVQTKLSEEAEEADEGKLDEPDDEDSHAPTAPKKKRRLRVVKRGADGKPDHWEDVLRGIQEMRASQIAAVDVAGIEAMFDDGDGKFEPHVARFHMLISAMLSSQTKDPVNAAAMKRLIAHGLTVAEMLAIDEKLLKELIYPVGFYNNKVRYIKQVAQILTDKAAEAGDKVVDIPDTFEALVALPGVGPKMAHLVMSCAWDNTVGICVDTHVHRISNRLGWVSTWNKKNPKSQDPEKTRKELEDWLPREHWNPINVTLVGFGQTVCLPRGPKCSECKISHLCPSAFSSAI